MYGAVNKLFEEKHPAFLVMYTNFYDGIPTEQ